MFFAGHKKSVSLLQTTPTEVPGLTVPETVQNGVGEPGHDGSEHFAPAHVIKPSIKMSEWLAPNPESLSHINPSNGFTPEPSHGGKWGSARQGKAQTSPPTRPSRSTNEDPKFDKIELVERQSYLSDQFPKLSSAIAGNLSETSTEIMRRPSDCYDDAGEAAKSNGPLELNRQRSTASPDSHLPPSRANSADKVRSRVTRSLESPFVRNQDETSNTEDFDSPHLSASSKPETFIHLSPKKPATLLDETSSVISNMDFSSDTPLSGRSSITSGTKLRLCHKCEKPAQLVSQLYKCVKCPRRYHSHCAVPKIPSGYKTSTLQAWVCKHCLKKMSQPEDSFTYQGDKALPNLDTALKFTVDQASISSLSDHEETFHEKIAGTEPTTRPPETNGQLVSVDHSPLQEYVVDWSTLGAASVPESQALDSYRQRNVDEINGDQLRTSSSSESLYRGRARLGAEQVVGMSPSSSASRATARRGRSLSLSSTKSNLTFVTKPSTVAHKKPDTGVKNKRPPAKSRPPPSAPKGPRSLAQSGKSQLKNYTCHFWKAKGNCKYREEDCLYAHRDTGMAQDKHMTCYWWWANGYCRYSSSECRFAHHDTGVYAEAPPGTFPRVRAPVPERPEVTYGTRSQRSFEERPPAVPKSDIRPSGSPQYDHYSPERRFSDRSWTRRDHYSPQSSVEQRHEDNLDNPARRDSSSKDDRFTQNRSHSPVEHSLAGSITSKFSNVHNSLAHSSSSVVPVTTPESSRDNKHAFTKDLQPLQKPNIEAGTTTSTDPRLTLKRKMSWDSVAESGSPLTNNSNLQLGGTDHVLSESHPLFATTSTPLPAGDKDIATSVKNCAYCGKRVIGSALFCMACRGRKQDVPKSNPNLSPVIPETPAPQAVLAAEIKETPAIGTPQPVAEKKIRGLEHNSLKRPAPVHRSTNEDELFIPKKRRVFKPSQAAVLPGQQNPPPTIALPRASRDNTPPPARCNWQTLTPVIGKGLSQDKKPSNSPIDPEALPHCNGLENSQINRQLTSYVNGQTDLQPKTPAYSPISDQAAPQVVGDALSQAGSQGPLNSTLSAQPEAELARLREQVAALSAKAEKAEALQLELDASKKRAAELQGSRAEFETNNVRLREELSLLRSKPQTPALEPNSVFNAGGRLGGKPASDLAPKGFSPKRPMVSMRSSESDLPRFQESKKSVLNPVVPVNRRKDSETDAGFDIDDNLQQKVRKSLYKVTVSQLQNRDPSKVVSAADELPPRSNASTKKDEGKLIRILEARGVEFESGSDSEAIVELAMPPLTTLSLKLPWTNVQESSDLFEVAPHYRPETMLFDLDAKKKEIASRLSRKQTFGRVLSMSRREQGGNVHRDVCRKLPIKMMRVHIDESSDEEEDGHAASSHKPMTVEMSFAEFLETPENALLCKTTTGQLAYRDGSLDVRGRLPRVPDEDKFEIGSK